MWVWRYLKYSGLERKKLRAEIREVRRGGMEMKLTREGGGTDEGEIGEEER